MDFPDRIPALRELAHKCDRTTAELAEHVLSHPPFAFCTGSIGEGKHHHGTGGLQQHTWEVVTLCMKNWAWATEHTKHPINRSHLFSAALWHDFGKAWDYKWTSDAVAGYWLMTPHRRVINHMNRSAIEWSCVARNVADQETHDEVLHAILAHHGDYGSSLLPKTRLAWMLHLCDQMSARLHDADTLDLSKRP